MVRGGAGRDWMIGSDGTDNLRVESMAAGSAMAPFPVSPQASFLEIGEITVTPRSSRAVKWRRVKGDVHMNVFIAGATNMGFEKSQARTMHVRRLSHKPPATCTSFEELVTLVQGSKLPWDRNNSWRTRKTYFSLIILQAILRSTKWEIIGSKTYDFSPTYAMFYTQSRTVKLNMSTNVHCVHWSR